MNQDASAGMAGTTDSDHLRRLTQATRLYETLLSTTNDFAYIFDPQGRFVYANASLLKVYAKTLDEVVGRNFHELGYPAWHADMHAREIEGIVKSKQSFRGEIPFTGDSGIFGVYDYIFQPVLDAAGDVEFIVGTTRDITARKQAEEKVQIALKEKGDSELRYRFLADSIPQIAWTAKPDGNLDYYNQRGFDYTGADPEKMESVSWVDFVHPEDMPHAGQVWLKSLQTGCDYEVEFRILRASDKIYRWHLVRAFPLKNEKGEVVQWIGTCTDIDDQRQFGKQLAEAAAKFRSLFDQSSFFIGILDLEGKLLEANSLSLEGCGYRAEQVIGKPFWDCGWWSGSEEVQQKIRGAVQQAAEGRPYSATLNYYWADGTERVVDFSLNPIRDADGKVILISPSGSDVTERHRAQAQFAAVVESSEDAIISKSLDGIIRSWNAGAERIFGYKADEIVGKSILELIPAELHKEELGIIARLKSGERIEHFETLRLGKGERRIDISLTISPIKDSSGKVIGVSKIARDITQEKRRQEAQRESEARFRIELERLVGERTASLREAVSQMEEFSYSVSHDLRAPLRAMQGYASALLEDYAGKIDQVGQDYLKHIAAAAHRMDRLTRDVLVYSKIPRTEFRVNAVDLDRLVTDIVRQNIPDESSRASVVIAHPLLPVLGNESFLAQSISNLIDNAVKFAAKDRPLRIDISTQRHAGQVRLWIVDNGIGILPEHQARVWGMFERIHPQKLYEGTGIGLAIVRKTVERMEGTMGVESDGRSGSKFWIQLPEASLHD